MADDMAMQFDVVDARSLDRSVGLTTQCGRVNCCTRTTRSCISARTHTRV